MSTNKGLPYSLKNNVVLSELTKNEPVLTLPVNENVVYEVYVSGEGFRWFVPVWHINDTEEPNQLEFVLVEVSAPGDIPIEIEVSAPPIIPN